MTHDDEPQNLGRTTHPIDDDDVARLVREVADGWVMPPVRLDQPSWRERLRSPRSRRAASVKGWFERLGQAATAAVILTVAAALVAVYLTRSRPEPGSSPGPTSQATPRSSPQAVGSPMPKLFVTGDLPSPAEVLVQLQEGDFAVVDLANGMIGSTLTASSWGSQVRRAPNGALICLCNSPEGFVQGSTTHVTMSFDRFDAAGRVTSRQVVLDLTGQPDPRDSQSPEQPGHLAAFTTFSADGRYGYVGWSARAHPVWTSGIVVVDLDSGTVLERLALPDRSDGLGDFRTFVDAPRVIGQAGDRAVINRSSYSWSAASPNATGHPTSDVFSVRVADGSLGHPTELVLGSGCGDDVTLAGGLADGGMWLSCLRYGPSALTIVRRIGADGSLGGDASIGTAAVEGSTAAVSPDGTFLYLWNPVELRLTRVELATGQTTSTTGPNPAPAADVLTALGRWLAPSASAKTFLQAGIAVSSDGSRVYALGIDGDPGAPEPNGSAGLFVFDAGSMAWLDRWDPTADFVSVAVSGDGSSIYAAGLSRADAHGEETGQPASITVFATDGTIRLIAGQLGRQTLTFTSTTLR